MRLYAHNHCLSDLNQKKNFEKKRLDLDVVNLLMVIAFCKHYIAFDTILIAGEQHLLQD